MLKSVFLSHPRYHSPTTLPLRITRRPVLPSPWPFHSQAALSLSQSTPVSLRILAFASSSGSPESGSRLGHPPLVSGGGKFGSGLAGSAAESGPAGASVRRASS